jgi:hypothetical protein
MYLWMPMVVLGVVKLFCALIDWRARIGYERARAASIVDVLRAVPTGATVRDGRADGTVLCIDIPGRQELYSCGVHETTGRKPC